MEFRPQQLSCSNAQGCTRYVKNEREPRGQAASEKRLPCVRLALNRDNMCSKTS